MAITNYGLSNLFVYDRDLIAVQTFDGFVVTFNTAGVGFNATKGLGSTNSVSSRVMFNFVAKNARGKITLRYPSPTAQGAEDLSQMIRCLNQESGQNTYYLIRQHAQVASIGKVIAGAAIVTLDSQPFLVPQDTPFDINFTINGPLIDATFTAPSVTMAHVAASDNAIPGPGMFGFQSQASKDVFCALAQYTQQPG